MDFKPSKQEELFLELIQGTPAPGKHCARNARFHLERAYRLMEVEPTMAAFCALTAEEEAANAIFHSLRRNRYQGWEKISPRDHKFKVALYPFITAVADLLQRTADTLRLEPQLFLDADKRWMLRFRLPQEIARPGKEIATTAPLEFNVIRNGRLYDFGAELEQLAKAQKKPIENHVRKLADVRNELLYANEAGVPRVLECERLVELQRKRVENLALVYTLIEQAGDGKQLAQQALFAFLKMMNRLPDDIQF